MKTIYPFFEWILRQWNDLTTLMEIIVLIFTFSKQKSKDDRRIFQLSSLKVDHISQNIYKFHRVIFHHKAAFNKIYLFYCKNVLFSNFSNAWLRNAFTWFTMFRMHRSEGSMDKITNYH